MDILNVFKLPLLTFLFIEKVCCILKNNIPEDATLNTTGLATKYGHPPMEFDVVTEDGYILTLYRLPGRSSIPVLLNHGLQDTSDSWLLRGNRSLAITLANHGYDTWLANNRGNRYSRRHQYLNPDKDTAFWDFSFHEMGCYDLPAIINTILKETGAQNLTAIGISQGNTMFYVLGSERKEYNSKINVLIALAPIAFLHNAPALKTNMVKQYFASDSDGKREFYGDNTPDGQLCHRICSDPVVGYIICSFAFFTLMGYDPSEMESDFFNVVAMHWPAGGSILNNLHFLQIADSKRFAQYDYGRKINLWIYNSTEPPEYHLDQVTMPIALFVGSNDRLSALADVSLLRDKLPNVVYYLKNPRRKINHIDYILGRNMHIYLFPYIFKVLYHYNN